MNCITLAAVTLLTLGDVQVLHKNGNTMEGRVVNVSTEFVVIETAEGESRFVRDDIQSVVNDDVTSEQPVGEPIRIQLRDNSVLWSPRLNVNGQNAVVAVEGRKLEVPLPKIHYVRLKNRKENDSRWKEILSRRARADSIVVQGPEELEALDGVLGNVTDSHVTFEFDGESIDVKRPKVGDAPMNEK